MKPKRTLNQKEKEVKENSKKIIERIELGEKVVTSVVHVSEIANILEFKLGVEKALKYIDAIVSNENIKVLGMDFTDMLKAIEITRLYKIDLVDAIAVTLMKKIGINEIYSQDHDFDRIDVKRIDK